MEKIVKKITETKMALGRSKSAITRLETKITTEIKDDIKLHCKFFDGRFY